MPAVILLFVAIGLLAAGAGWAAIRASGAQPGIARRFAGAREHRVGDLLDIQEPPARPIRVVGRVRCADPLRTAEGDTLVAYHRDVDVELPRGGWRPIERLRETRSFDLWDHDGAATVDPALASEPLVTIPHVWRGEVAELEASFGPAIERLAASGTQPGRARAVTRTISTVERVGVLALVRREGAVVRLDPPRGGFVLSTVDLPAAMRLLAGPRRRLMVAGYAGILGGALLLVLTALGAVLTLIG